LRGWAENAKKVRRTSDFPSKICESAPLYSLISTELMRYYRWRCSVIKLPLYWGNRQIIESVPPFATTVSLVLLLIESFARSFHCSSHSYAGPPISRSISALTRQPFFRIRSNFQPFFQLLNRPSISPVPLSFLLPFLIDVCNVLNAIDW